MSNCMGEMQMNIPNIARIKKYISCPRSIRNTESVKMLSVQKENLQLISCSNVIVHIKTDEIDGYLCECGMHLPILQYIENFAHVYFSCFCDASEETNGDRKLIHDAIKNPDTLLKFSNIGRESPYVNSPYRRYLDTDDGEEIGLDLSSADEQQKRRIRHFVERYAWPQLVAYYANLSPSGDHHVNSSNKVLATEAMARLIGLEHTIPHTEYVKVCVTDAGNCVLFGSFMEKAQGMCAMDIPPERRRAMLTPEFQRSLLNMNLLDVICHEMDHSPNNYNVVLNAAGNAVDVSVYDNNGLGTFSLNGSIDYQTYKKCSSIVNAEGRINRPCLDKAVVMSIMKLRFHNIYDTIYPFYKMPIILSTWKRIVKLKRAVRKSMCANPGLLLEEKYFSEETIQKELSGAYGKTYLLSFLQDCLYRAEYR